MTATPSHAPAGQRLDKWLWFARFFKSRTLAQAFITQGRVRINRIVAAKAGFLIHPGDVLTFALGPRVRVVRVLQAGSRRASPGQARLLYEDLAPPAPTPPAVVAAGIGPPSG